ncbi:MAG TPA: cysteine--tRNA ligase [Acidimicrobiales bacterium]|jgi:cysteinyl-tRNA synthetase|nr:cysteine--tRNA ligase [Acidimicrobiales bacterium]
MLRLHDSALGRVVDVVPRVDGQFSMYVCGPTVDGPPHIGHGRFTLTWDVVRRWLEFTGLEVNHVSNVTDIEDKIIARAAREHRSETSVAEEYEAQWWEVMDALGVLRPTSAPHATAYVAEMIEMIGTLLDTGHAYVTDDGVYLDTLTVPDYGLLAGQPLDTLRAGARVEIDEQKRTPFDFALWKAAKPGEPSWEAPFGAGRPGWHTECVVMSLALLGEDFDLHSGGQDLKFPHHENERAQAVALGKGFARHWAHNGWVVVEGVKMSKSLNNFTTLADLLSRADARAYRLLLLRAHYRGPIEVTTETIADAERALARLDEVARRFDLTPIEVMAPVRRSEHAVIGEHPDVVAAFESFVDDDLNTPSAVATLFDLAASANRLADAGDLDVARGIATLLMVLAASLGLAVRGADLSLDEHSAGLAAARDAARSRGEFAEADRLRDELVALGFVVEDTAAGTRVRRA